MFLFARRRFGWFIVASLLLLPRAWGAESASGSGIDEKGMDKAIAPGNDFYDFTNGAWLATTEIPPDRGSWGTEEELSEATDKQIVALIEAAANDPSRATPMGRLAADYYTAFMDEPAIEAKGIAPLEATLKKISTITDRSTLSRALGASLRADVDALNSTNFYTENIFGLWVAQGFNDPKHYTPYLLQGGLGLPNREYYIVKNERMESIRSSYQAHIANVLRLAGVVEADARAARIFALESQIAQTHVSPEDTEDVLKANNPWQRRDFARKAPGMDWLQFFKGSGLGKQSTFIVWHPSAVIGAAALVSKVPVADWRDFLIFHTLNHFSGVLPTAFADQAFALYGTTLSGTPQQSVRWKRGLASTNLAIGDAVGQLYVSKYFPPASKAKVQAMVTNIVAAFGRRIDRLEWMAPATKEEARAKLKSLYVGIGYPDHWKDYTGLKIDRTDALGNKIRAEEFNYAKQVARLGKAVDTKEWCMDPQVVNAVNMPMQNALNFPAATLQPPVFDPAAPDAVNYGNIGATIGHEISHSFDDQGSQFDAQGRLRDWWSAEDLAHFKASTAALAAQYSTYHPFSDASVNGQQTLSENLADLAGLTASFDAYHHAAEGNPTGSNSAYTGDQLFFISYAQSWRRKMREAGQRMQLIQDGHAPAKYRASTVRNIGAWYDAFAVKPGQSLYLEPSARVRVW